MGWCPVELSDDDDESASFQGGPHRLEFLLHIRSKAMAMAKLAHLKALSMYTDALFEYASCVFVPEGFRKPSCAEIIAADKAALSEAFRMRAKGQGDLQACLVHVAKPGGFMQSLLQPKQLSEKKDPSQVSCLWLCCFSLSGYRWNPWSASVLLSGLEVPQGVRKQWLERRCQREHLERQR